MDSFKDKLSVAKTKAGDLAQQHGGKIESGLEKAAHTVDSKTGGKYSEKIGSGVDKAKGALDNLKDKGSETASGPDSAAGPATGTDSATGPGSGTGSGTGAGTGTGMTKDDGPSA
ncbi:antitoxin [Actinacidiphila alni]|nr:antitoxin [Actinacidiphila alni]